ncbi:Hypothetical predicted protein [Mytilus galloprovincialis]|uniref:Reelin domain-containing protein n=1 Tax=Mytilus galloprovincialis TaxID=29158 RepID=A0A8B6D6C6_MYTGA|nr:Hypothetical predicted protein [Mytilus galloprovincialis]
MSTMLKKLAKVTEILVIVCLTTVYCFWNGAPINTCLSSATFHTKVLNETHMGQYLPMNNSEMNYTLTVSKLEYKNLTLPKMKPKQDYIRVTLRAAPNDYFRGFFVQATRADFPLEAINRPAYGTFRPLDANSQARRCRAAVGGVGGITHTNNRDKNVVSFDWYPPASCNLGNVQFVATVVKQYNEYWVDVRSPNVTGIGFQGERGILCQLYNDPFNTGIQQEVIRLLSQQQQQQGQQQGQQQQARTAG